MNSLVSFVRLILTFVKCDPTFMKSRSSFVNSLRSFVGLSFTFMEYDLTLLKDRSTFLK